MYRNVCVQIVLFVDVFRSVTGLDRKLFNRLKRTMNNFKKYH